MPKVFAFVPQSLFSKQKYILFFLLLLLLFSMFASLQIGSANINLFNIANFSKIDLQILLQIRLPRLLLGLLSGVALGLVGVAMQSLFNNPLADPGLIGIASGNALGAVIFILFGQEILFVFINTQSTINSIFADSTINLDNIYDIMNTVSYNLMLTISAFIGGLVCAIAIYLIAKSSNINNIQNLLLAGIAVNAIAGSIIGFLIFFAKDGAMREIVFWTMGSLANAKLSEVIVGLILITIPSIVLLASYKDLNAILLGEDNAKLMGYNLYRIKKIILMISVLCVGIAVSLCGIINFVGLIAPHIARYLIGVNHKYLLPIAALIGAILVVNADIVARVILSPIELPIGLVLSIIGAPWFLLLLLKYGDGRYNKETKVR